jgi:SAM-dependent methyltransferase
MSEMFSYDAVPYPSKFFLQTHPDRLAAAGILYGMSPTAPQKCRVLELGCGNGSNLVAHAFGLPDSEFVGVDLAETHIVQANASAIELGLTNVEFRQMDVTEMSEGDFGKFDYITAHGLFSWVPDFVRERVLQLFDELLTPNGIGYVSYNAYPGAHTREMVRSIMRFHTRAIDEPQAKVDQAISFLKLLAENATGPETYGPILRAEFQRHQAHSVEDIYHDDLGDFYRPFYFHEFASLLGENGMQFLSEAELHASSLSGISDEAANFIRSMDEVAAREQYLDLLRGRVFRQTLFCRKDVSLDHEPKPEILDKLYLSSTLTPVDKINDLNESKVEKFRTAKGQQMQIDHPLTKAALLHLGEIWGGSIATNELIDAAASKLNTSNVEEKDRDIVRSILMQLSLGSDLVEIHSYAPEATTEAGIRPKVNRLSHWQLRDCTNVLTLFNKDLKLNDDLARELIRLMDGTRTKMKLATDMQAFVRSQKDIEGKHELIGTMPTWIDESVAELARLGVFEAASDQTG